MLSTEELIDRKRTRYPEKRTYAERKASYASPPPADAPRLTGDPRAASTIRDPDTGRLHPIRSAWGKEWL